ncbi:MAG TPA: serine hydrolase [Labilithrix sp.]|nr:serine hydrolase [Labilithrix sp.]
MSRHFRPLVVAATFFAGSLLACAEDAAPIPGESSGKAEKETTRRRADDDETTGSSTTSTSPASPSGALAAKVVAPVVAALASEVEERSPGTELGLAVYDFDTKEYAGTNDDDPHISASSAKAIWVAAALKKVGIDPVSPHARPIFEVSSNSDATEVIKLAGANYINDFYALAGMKKSAFTQWNGQKATNSPKLLGSDNYFTARDATSFLRGLHEGTLLDATLNAQLEEWMTWSPRDGYGGWLGTLLPESARASLEHKAGWLPPDLDDRSVNEIGLVEAGKNHWYAIAILARKGDDYDAEQAFVEHASCEVYKAIASQAELDCE